MEPAQRTLHAVHSNDGGGSFHRPHTFHSAANPRRRPKQYRLATDSAGGQARRSSQLLISRTCVLGDGGVRRGDGLEVCSGTSGVASHRTPPGRLHLACDVRPLQLVSLQIAFGPPQPELHNFVRHLAVDSAQVPSTTWPTTQPTPAEPSIKAHLPPRQSASGRRAPAKFIL